MEYGPREWLRSLGYVAEAGEIEEISWLYNTTPLRCSLKYLIKSTVPQNEAKKMKLVNLLSALSDLSPGESIKAPCASIKDLQEYLLLKELKSDHLSVLNKQNQLKDWIQMETSTMEDLGRRYDKLRDDQGKEWRLIEWQEKRRKDLAEICAQLRKMNVELQSIMEGLDLTTKSRDKAKELVNNCFTLMSDADDEEQLFDAMLSIYFERVPATFVYSELVDRIEELTDKLTSSTYVDPGSSIDLMNKRTCSLSLEIAKEVQELQKVALRLKEELNETVEEFIAHLLQIVSFLSDLGEKEVRKMARTLTQSKSAEHKKVYLEKMKESRYQLVEFKKESRKHEQDVRELDDKIVSVVGSIKVLMAGNTEELKKYIENSLPDFSIPSSMERTEVERVNNLLLQEEAAFQDLVSSQKPTDILKLLENLEALALFHIKRKQMDLAKKQMNEAKRLSEVEALTFDELHRLEPDESFPRVSTKVTELLSSAKDALGRCHETLEFWKNNPFNTSLAEKNVCGRPFGELLEEMKKNIGRRRLNK